MRIVTVQGQALEPQNDLEGLVELDLLPDGFSGEKFKMQVCGIGILPAKQHRLGCSNLLESIVPLIHNPQLHHDYEHWAVLFR